MNIVANAGSVFGIVVFAKNFNMVDFAFNRLQNQRNEVRFGFVAFADITVGRAAGSIEVAQSDVF